MPNIVYQGSLISVVQQDVTKNGDTKTFEYAERSPGVRMIIINEQGNICITKERRYELNQGSGGYDFRLPGGKVVDTLDEFLTLQKQGSSALLAAATDAVRLEAKEEVGIEPHSIEFLRRSSCGATMRRDLYYFVITDFSLQDSGQALGWGEDITVGWYTPAELTQLCLSGQISEDRTVAVLLQWLDKR